MHMAALGNDEISDGRLGGASGTRAISADHLAVSICQPRAELQHNLEKPVAPMERNVYGRHWLGANRLSELKPYMVVNFRPEAFVRSRDDSFYAQASVEGRP